MPAGAWNFDRSGWGSHKYVTPELLRAKGIGSGFYKNKPGYTDFFGGGKGGPRRPGDVPEQNRMSTQGEYNLDQWEPWTEWGGQSKYDDYVKQYQDLYSQIQEIPQIGTEDDLIRLTDLSNQARGYKESASKLHDEGKSIQDDYIREWLKAYDIRYNPDAEVGGGRYEWDSSTGRGRDMQERSDKQGHYSNRDHWTSYGWDEGREDTTYRTIKQGYHKWPDHTLDAIQREFKLRPPEPEPDPVTPEPEPKQSIGERMDQGTGQGRGQGRGQGGYRGQTNNSGRRPWWMADRKAGDVHYGERGRVFKRGDKSGNRRNWEDLGINTQSLNL